MDYFDERRSELGWDVLLSENCEDTSQENRKAEISMALNEESKPVYTQSSENAPSKAEKTNLLQQNTHINQGAVFEPEATLQHS